MKKNNNTPTLQELLGSVEHAGRDARRQQQLAEMIERMAAEENAQKAAHRHTVRMWSTRIAVAATITLFLTTSIWRWSNMGGSTEAPLVAQNPIVRPTEMPLPPTALSTILPLPPFSGFALAAGASACFTTFFVALSLGCRALHWRYCV